MTQSATSLESRVLELIAARPGLTDRELTDVLLGRAAAQQRINPICRRLAALARIVRQRRADHLLGNYLVAASSSGDVAASPLATSTSSIVEDVLTEDSLKRVLSGWLTAQGWTPQVAWGHVRGIDIDASRGHERWIIEVKGRGSRPEMRVNYFLGILGEALQRMDDPTARYSIALPDLPQFRRLEWLPIVAKSRIRVSALFVSEDGTVTAVR